ncbi:unnamed protein product [Protopolystoma xenopodis]|uniref:Endoplasmic reticulum metallopeptidase 1-like C-terminal domain-containing protein n=1 Tax=Protopolystoma xenopodis TaxID=117903 RepID=A0A3S5CJ71_9PLAT|nr:unnamed protein product [Protopolystoma xenopodis]
MSSISDDVDVENPGSYDGSQHYVITHLEQSLTEKEHIGEVWSAPFTFWLTISQPLHDQDVESSPSKNVIDIALSAQYLDPARSSGVQPYLTSVVNRLPDFVVPTSWVSTYEMWRIHLH